MCRLPEKIQHIAETFSSAAEDSCDHYKIQNKNSNKTKSEIYKAILAVKNITIKFIIDTDSPNTIIPESLHNNISDPEAMKIKCQHTQRSKIG